MNEPNLESRVSTVVTRFLIRTPIDLTVSSHLIKLGVLDSLGVIRIATEINDEFGITLRNSDINPRTFSSIERIGRLVETYLVGSVSD